MDTERERFDIMNNATAITAPGNEGFRVWVSTFGLYNAGALLGYWVDASEAPETVEEFRAGLDARGIDYARYVEQPWNEMGEELHCFDTENAPIDGEMSPSTAREFAAVLDAADIPEDEMPAFLTVWAGEHGSTVDELETLAGQWAELFGGYWDSAEDYAAEYVEDTGMLNEVPESLRCYFDMEAFARDLQLGGDISFDRTDAGAGFVILEGAR